MRALRTGSSHPARYLPYLTVLRRTARTRRSITQPKVAVLNLTSPLLHRQSREAQFAGQRRQAHAHARGRSSLFLFPREENNEPASCLLTLTRAQLFHTKLKSKLGVGHPLNDTGHALARSSAKVADCVRGEELWLAPHAAFLSAEQDSQHLLPLPACLHTTNKPHSRLNALRRRLRRTAV